MPRIRCQAAFLAGFVFFAAAASSGSRGEFVLAADGRAAARIVLPPDPHPMEREAAQELRDYVKKVSGAALPVVEGGTGTGPAVVIGVRDPVLRRKLDLGSLAFDGFVIDCRPGRLILAGNVPEGTLNAVYEFLESVVGVRWFVPGELGENVPRRRTIGIPFGRRRDEPRFVNRRNHGIDLSIPGDGARWRQRNRITSHALNVPFNRYSHWLYRIFPPSKYGKTHPEYYPLIHGKRFVPESDTAQNWQPCTTNPDVIRLTIEAARRWYDTHPRSNFFSVGINDSAAFCECAACRRLDVPGATFRGRRMLSDRYFTFVKQVADAVAQTHPDRFITCIAYSVVEEPPRRVRIPRNVAVILTQDVGQWHDPEYKADDMRLARAWARAAGAFGSYNYTGLTWLMPRVYPHAMADSIRFYDQIGAVAVTNEAYPTWWYAAPQMYLRAKLMWNPKLDPDAVLQEFYAGFFGPACDAMAAFYAALERCMMKKRPGRWFEGLSSVLQQMDLWERKDLEECRRALERAKSAVAGRKPYEARVDFVARGFAFADAMLEEYWQAQRVRALASAGTASPRTVALQLRELLRRTAVREAVWRRIRKDRLISGIYRLVFEHYPSRLATWRSYLDGSVSTGLSAVAMDPDAGIEHLRGLLSDLERKGPAADVLDMLWARQHPDAPNLCRNPGFEDTRDKGAPRGVDWVAGGSPPGWAKWALKPENRSCMTWEQRGGRRDSHCVRLTGVSDACFIQVREAAPGERYFASAWTRITGRGRGRARLVVQWQDAAGRWMWSRPRREAAVTGTGGKWRRLSLVFTVPEGARRAVLLLAAKDQDGGNSVWFDDIRLVRLPEKIPAE